MWQPVQVLGSFGLLVGLRVVALPLFGFGKTEPPRPTLAEQHPCHTTPPIASRKPET